LSPPPPTLTTLTTLSHPPSPLHTPIPAKASKKLKHWKTKDQVGILSKMKSNKVNADVGSSGASKDVRELPRARALVALAPNNMLQFVHDMAAVCGGRSSIHSGPYRMGNIFI